MAQVTIVIDYPDEMIRKYGVADVDATFRARLAQVYPGYEGVELAPHVVSVDVGASA